MHKIFVCHHPPLTHRKEYLDNFFSSMNIEVEWVENFSPEEITEDYDQIVGVKDLVINPNVPGVQQNQYTLYENAGRKVTIPELSAVKFTGIEIVPEPVPGIKLLNALTNITPPLVVVPINVP